MKISEFFKKKKKPENIQTANTTNNIEEKEEIKENRTSVYPAFDPSTLLSKDIFSDCSIINDSRNMCSNININNKNNSSISINNNSITINGKSMSFDGLDRNIKIIINNSKIWHYGCGNTQEIQESDGRLLITNSCHVKNSKYSKKDFLFKL